ncbi:MAG: hypothetical protein AAB706_02960, partial [Patescibacteria group bacterium]
KKEARMRKCYLCPREITNCFGFVKAGDFLEYIDGKRKADQIRELCGHCALLPLCMNESQLNSFFLKIGWLMPQLSK